MAQDPEVRPLDPEWDADGDAITVHSKAWFPMGGEGMVQAVFAQGTDPAVAARALRKFAELLEGYDRHTLANIGLGQRDLNYAVRFEDGRVELINTQQDFKDWQESEEGRAYRARQRSAAAQ